MPVSMLSQAAFTLVGRKYRMYSHTLDNGPCCSLFLFTSGFRVEGSRAWAGSAATC